MRKTTDYISGFLLAVLFHIVLLLLASDALQRLPAADTRPELSVTELNLSLGANPEDAPAAAAGDPMAEEEVETEPPPPEKKTEPEPVVKPPEPQPVVEKASIVAPEPSPIVEKKVKPPPEPPTVQIPPPEPPKPLEPEVKSEPKPESKPEPKPTPQPAKATAQSTSDSTATKSATPKAANPGNTLSDSAGSGSGASGNVIGPVSAERILRPYYPLGARKRGEQGTVTFEVLVSRSGAVKRITVLTSSGYKDLDAAAERALKRARFKPGTKDGKPIEALAVVPIQFKLTDTSTP